MPAQPLAAHRQADHPVRLEWGPTGGLAIARGAAYAVVVDVLSFTTTVTVAAERGIVVLPYRWRDATAASYAEARGARLARGRREALVDGGPSLSPASLLGLDGVERLVLPSPNGSTIAGELADSGVTVVAASLRNARAVAAWLAGRVGDGAAVALVAAGERWPDGSLRPAVEDWWGAGAVASALLGEGVGGLSPEAAAAAAAFAAVRPGLPDALAGSASGRELTDAGFAADVAIAAEHNTAEVVPVLRDGAFTAG